MFISLGAPGASDYQGEAFLYQVSDGSTTGPIDAEFGRSALVSTTNNLYESKYMYIICDRVCVCVCVCVCVSVNVVFIR